MWRHASLVLAALAAPAGAQAQTVGSVTSANQQARGTPPGGAARPLSLGLGIVQNERIQTDAAGTAQISFNDRSTMSIGRSSTVVVNRHVYDPGSGTGAQATSLLRGALRYVGGDVSHGGNATVTTPVATLGVRGGVASIALEQQGGRQVFRGESEFVFTPLFESERKGCQWEIPQKLSELLVHESKYKTHAHSRHKTYLKY